MNYALLILTNLPYLSLKTSLKVYDTKKKIFDMLIEVGQFSQEFT